MGQIKVEKNVGGIEGLCVIEPAVHGDARGYFMETYNEKDMKEAGIDIHFVQDNQSMSTKGVLRGLHFQKQYPQCKLVRAVRSMMAEGLRPEDVTEQSLADHLYTAGQPDPDFLIRTSGEQRLSNYLLYQCAYSEFYFTPTPWPDFGVEALHEALAVYAGRSRRFGKTQEQINGR